MGPNVFLFHFSFHVFREIAATFILKRREFYFVFYFMVHLEDALLRNETFVRNILDSDAPCYFIKNICRQFRRKIQRKQA